MVREDVGQFYNDYPFPGKVNSYGSWQELAPRLLNTLKLPIEELSGARVLDAGCGTGEYARSFSHHGARVTAIDYSPNALNTARKLDAQLGISNIEYRREDLLDLPNLGIFDFIFSLGVLHHTANPFQGFQNLCKCLCPGGYLLVGLYSSISRIHILMMRRFLRITSLGNQERAINIAHNWLRPILPYFIGKENAGDRTRVADLLVHPHEKPVSLHTTLSWFQKENLAICGCNPSCSIDDYPSLKRLFGQHKSNLVFILMQLYWLMWNADYYQVGGRSPNP